MPFASQGEIKYWLKDHDTDVVFLQPPVEDTWYEVFHAYDVRLLWCRVRAGNDEETGERTQVKWTIDGNEYFTEIDPDDWNWYYIFRFCPESAGGTDGLQGTTNVYNAGYHIDKKGLEFKVEVRVIEIQGTNPILTCECVYETLEVT